jgi:hypothetical protein
MSKFILLVLALVVISLTGCAENELHNCKLQVISMKGDMDELQADFNAAQTELNSQKTSYEDKISQLKEENKQIQQKAMESITKMLTKQAEADKKIQESLQMQIESLTKENAVLKDKITRLQDPNQQ